MNPFEVLDPPPHGLTRLRAGLNERRRLAVTWRLALATAAAALLLLWWAQPSDAVDLRAAAGVRFEDPVADVVGRGETGVQVMPSSDPHVVFARVSSTPSGNTPP